MRLTQIRDFVAVVDAGSISSAARTLGVSQPGLTKSIAALEAELNVALLRRTPRGISLTRFGRAFHARAHAAHSEVRPSANTLTPPRCACGPVSTTIVSGGRGSTQVPRRLTVVRTRRVQSQRNPMRPETAEPFKSTVADH